MPGVRALAVGLAACALVATAAANPYIRELLPVLSPLGAETLARLFRDPASFPVDITTTCPDLMRPNVGIVDPVTGRKHHERRPMDHNASRFIAACATDTEARYDWKQWSMCPSGQPIDSWCLRFAGEMTIPTAVRASPWLATPPPPPSGWAESQMSSAPLGRPSAPGAAHVVELYATCYNGGRRVPMCVKYLRENNPLFTTEPERFFFVLTEDYGTCGFHSHGGPLAPEFVSTVPVLANNGNSRPDRGACFNGDKDVVIPTPNYLVGTLHGDRLARAALKAESSPRPTLAAMVVGTPTQARTTVLRLFRGESDFALRDRTETFQEAIDMYLGAKFCIQADGAAPWSPRVTEYAAAGCVPVLLSDHLIPPFHRALNWSLFSVRVPTAEVTGLAQRLRGLVASGVYDALFANVLRAREALRYDATDGAVGATPILIAEMAMVLARRSGGGGGDGVGVGASNAAADGGAKT